MTRDQCIEAKAEKMHRQAIGGWGVSYGIDYYKGLATAAYDAMADHIRAERERGEGLMLDKCRDAVSGFMDDVCNAAIACDDPVEMRLISERSHTITAIFQVVNALEIGGENG